MKVIPILFLILLTASSLFAADPGPEYFLRKIVGITTAEIANVEKQANDGEPIAQLLIGLLKRRTRNSALNAYQNPGEGILWLQRSADQGYAPAAYFIVSLCQDQMNEGIYGTDPCKKVDHYLEKGIAKNYPAAIWYEGYFASRKTPRDCTTAITSYARAGNLGDPDGFYSIAKLYDDGVCVPEDMKLANFFYEKAAFAGHAGAEDSLGIRISEGVGTKSNNKEAVKWFKKSGDQGHVYGSCNLALHYLRGWGVAKNPLLALKWSFVANLRDGLKYNPGDLARLLRPRKGTVIQARDLAISFLRQRPWLTNNFDERPWLDAGAAYPVTLRER